MTRTKVPRCVTLRLVCVIEFRVHLTVRPAALWLSDVTLCQQQAVILSSREWFQQVQSQGARCSGFPKRTCRTFHSIKRTCNPNTSGFIFLEILGSTMSESADHWDIKLQYRKSQINYLNFTLNFKIIRFRVVLIWTLVTRATHRYQRNKDINQRFSNSCK